MNKDFKSIAIKHAKMRLRTHAYKDLMKLKTLRPAAGIVVLAGECLSADEISDYFDRVSAFTSDDELKAVGELIDESKYSRLNAEERERYMLKVSSFYRALKEEKRREEAGEKNISDNFKTHTTNNKLYIEEEHFWLWDKTHSRVTIYVPDSLDNVDIDIGAGKLILDSIQIKRLDLDLGSTETGLNNIGALKSSISGGAGKINATNSTFNDLELETGVGEVNLEGTITGRSSIETGVGKVNLNLLGGADIYQFNIDKFEFDINVNDFVLLKQYDMTFEFEKYNETLLEKIEDRKFANKISSYEENYDI